jgi:putative DNA primase/helicase
MTRKTADVIPIHRRKGFRQLPWPDRGTDVLTPEHLEYVHARVTPTYAKRMKLRSLAEGIVIPFWNADGTPMADFGTVRLLPARGSQKFRQEQGVGNRLYLAPLTNGYKWEEVLADPEVDLYICEGPFKAAALAQHGYAAIGLNGVWGWRDRRSGKSAPLPEFADAALKERKVVVVFDSDVHGNTDVQAALVCLTSLLKTKRHGAKAVFRLLPHSADGKYGVDDLIASKGIKAFRKLPDRNLGEKEFADWGLNKEPKETDTGNGIRFALQHADHIRYVHEWKEWILFDGTSWRRDHVEEVRDAARATVHGIAREALESTDMDARQRLLRWAADSESSHRLSSMLREASSQKLIRLRATELDTDPTLFTVANGVIDLRTGELLAPEPSQLLLKRSPVSYDPNAECPRFRRFLREIFVDDIELVDYMQRAVGYLMTGLTSEQCFFVWWGTGANGKGTLRAVLTALIGEYAATTRMETWMAQKRNAGGPSEDLARLQGVRMASAVETDEYHQLSEAIIKELSGGNDKIAARGIFERTVEFIPECKLILVANHKPTIRGTDHAIWRRVRLVPFTQTFPINRELEGELMAELPGILNWAVAGARAWHEHGLGEAQQVVEATKKYRSDSDVLRHFLADECELGDGPEFRVKAAVLYATYRHWTNENGHRALSATKFSQRLQERRIRRKRKTSGVWYVGVRVKREVQS